MLPCATWRETRKNLTEVVWIAFHIVTHRAITPARHDLLKSSESGRWVQSRKRRLVTHTRV